MTFFTVNADDFRCFLSPGEFTLGVIAEAGKVYLPPVQVRGRCWAGAGHVSGMRLAMRRLILSSQLITLDVYQEYSEGVSVFR